MVPLYFFDISMNDKIRGPLVKLVITLACHAGIRSSSLLGTANLGVVQSGRMLALGASGRRFKSYRRDHNCVNCVETCIFVYKCVVSR